MFINIFQMTITLYCSFLIKPEENCKKHISQILKTHFYFSDRCIHKTMIKVLHSQYVIFLQLDAKWLRKTQCAYIANINVFFLDRQFYKTVHGLAKSSILSFSYQHDFKEMISFMIKIIHKRL